MISKIERLRIKDIWKNEAYDFTPWLRDNIDTLNEILDTSLSNAESEQRVGSFSVDLIAEDESGNPIIIENQFGKSDHDHLGKLLTYSSFIEAKGAIWIVENPRPEHIKAITWLNEETAFPFYLIKVEAIKIDDSDPAPLFTLIVGPSEESRDVGEIKKDIAERYGIRKKFWTELLNKAKGKTKLHANISPGQYNWVGTSSGKRGLNYNYTVRQHSSTVELYIDRGTDSDEENLDIYNKLLENKKEIESEFGADLLWESLENRRACRISKTINIGGYKDDDKWENIQEEMIDTMIKFEKALKPYIKKIDV
ncbi:DUF4268 domain-containing protein [bacterium]|nr:DUF4268 domain-containing protein [bacterium]